MFSDHSDEPTSFPSTWKTEQSLESGGTQTEEVGTQDEECQVTDQIEAGVQTEEEEQKSLGPAEYDEASLSEFLKRVTPKVLRELDRRARSQAFLGYGAVEEEAGTGGKLLHTLRCNQTDQECVVSGMGWSSTGSVVGVSFGAGEHDDWCSHRGTIAVWNINRSDFDANQPERVIEAASCVLCLAFHPSNPALFAAGTFNGEILVYDLSRTEDVTPLAVGECGGGGVSTLAWVELGDLRGGDGGPHRAPHTLTATTTTGHVLVWALNLTKQTLTLKAGYMVRTQDIPRGVRTQVGEDTGVGIAAASYSPDDPSVFLVGGEGGSLFLCSANPESPTVMDLSGVHLHRCVTATLAPHTGRTLEAQFSPHHRHALLSAGSDNQIRLYSLLQPNKPITATHSEESVTCARWSPSRPLVFAAGLSSGRVVLHDLDPRTGRQQPFITLASPGRAVAVTALRFNHRNMTQLGVGDALGRVLVWQLPTQAVSPLPGELSTLQGLLDILKD
ncbi:cytoplasmic dynein 2 intermediate chain 2-like [Eriocheir sinensis]|uniref:cytoplasmic dynein 2 intermediate chain 2-like n=1 Tax=Eriocheir sinensis TaxID=95602 RepID=UPI0021C8A358|nr:cytoplasmic dynein 2 intermediate chain 2-like [Eriocheir sinensis]XP_050696257.1 cytoplasmic dynein 2 intermediate chain 2-like [Eriocheir sinensis]